MQRTYIFFSFGVNKEHLTFAEELGSISILESKVCFSISDSSNISTVLDVFVPKVITPVGPVAFVSNWASKIRSKASSFSSLQWQMKIRLKEIKDKNNYL